MSPKKWTLIPPAPPEFLAAFPELPNLVAHLLYHRGVRTQAAVDEFLNPDYSEDLHDPFLFRDMTRAVDRIIAARDTGERILVHGDYDADGVCGATVLLDTLEAIDCVVDVFLPNRDRDGFGFREAGLAYARERNARVIITCDCGISNSDTIRAAQEAGLDVIITDHHLVPLELPPAHAIIHPKVMGETYPYADLTGGGVAFKLCQAITQRDALSSQPRLSPGFEKWLLDCVAISTIADYGPLIGENRTLVTYGLVVLQKTRRLGLRALYDTAGINPAKTTPTTIGFQIAPRINAAGRIDHASEALALLRCQDPVEAGAIARRLNATNAERQRLVEDATAQALASVGEIGDRRFIVVAGEAWLPGIIGLIATRLRDRFHRPAIALTETEGKMLGSGRSIEGLHIVEALQSVSDLLVTFGGHPQACGLTLKEGVDLTTLAERLEAYARERLTADQLIPTLAIDWEIALEDVSWELVELLQRIEPFGVGNPTPRYLARGVTIDNIQQVGNGGKHLKILVHHHTPAQKKMIVFCYENICPKISSGDVVDAVFEVDVNEWNGNREIQLKVVDMRAAMTT